jgi:hypothetical protein
MYLKLKNVQDAIIHIKNYKSVINIYLILINNINNKHINKKSWKNEIKYNLKEFIFDVFYKYF